MEVRITPANSRGRKEKEKEKKKRKEISLEKYKPVVILWEIVYNSTVCVRIDEDSEVTSGSKKYYERECVLEELC